VRPLDAGGAADVVAAVPIPRFVPLGLSLVGVDDFPVGHAKHAHEGIPPLSYCPLHQTGAGAVKRCAELKTPSARPAPLPATALRTPERGHSVPLTCRRA